MKKFILFISFLILLTGCSTKVSYEFKTNEIKSTIDMTYTNADVDSYRKKFDGESYEITDYDSYIEDLMYRSAIIAHDKDEYLKKGHNKNNNEYQTSYFYTFNYDNFKDNYYLNECFDYFIHTENKDFYYYTIKGAYKCSYDNVKIAVSGNVIESNSNNIENGVHTFDVLKNENNIYFVISKRDINKKSAMFKWKVFGGIVLVILIVLTFIFIKKAN